MAQRPEKADLVLSHCHSQNPTSVDDGVEGGSVLYKHGACRSHDIQVVHFFPVDN